MIFISVVSHGHGELINKIKTLEKLSDYFFVVIKSNVPGEDFYKLSLNNNCIWIDENYGLGFGHNNNVIFQYCHNQLGMSSEDLFVVLNPDVDIDVDTLLNLDKSMLERGNRLSAINLYRDTKKVSFDNSIRKFPSLFVFVCSFFGLGNSSIIEKRQISEPVDVDWAAGSFLAFRAGHYLELRGFDQGYFMYCEDIDICYRSSKINHCVVYYPQLEAIHFAQHANRKVLSKHFYWHITSVMRFLLSKLSIIKMKSLL